MNFKAALVTLTLGLAAAQPALAGYDKPYIGEIKKYKAKYEDTFVRLARDNSLGYVELRAANPEADPWIPGEGRELILPSRHILPDAPREGVVINLPEMRMFAYVNGDEAPASFSIGIGREGLETPIGTTTVARKMEGPIWRPTPRMREEDPTLKESVGPGPDNPMGTHALYLGWSQYAIHGTDKPFGIGRRVSSGCIRLYPEDIITLYNMIPVGTKVTVVNQPLKLAWIGDELYLEAHTDIAQAIQMEETGQITRQKLTEADLKQITKAAGEYQDRVDWAAVRNAIRDRNGYPVMIARRPSSGVSEAKPHEEPKAEPVPEEEIKAVEEHADKEQEPEQVQEPAAQEEPAQTDGDSEEKEAAYNDGGKNSTVNP